MLLKKIMGGVVAAAIALAAADTSAIVEAIKANPSLLDSPQAKQVLQNGSKTSPSTVTETKVETPLNKVEPLPEEIPEQAEAPASAETADSLFRSPLRVEADTAYAKRLLASQITAHATPLKRYGIEFFANKNGMDLSSLPVPENYKIVPKDVLSVILYGPKSDNMSLSVDKDGSVVIPSFGPLKVAGLSFSDAKKTISDALMAAFPNVGVTVNITQFSTIQVTLAGEVATPGLYNVSSFSTVKEALIAAGGLSKNGSMREVQIKRNGRMVATVDLYRIIRGTAGRYDYLLKAGDVIVVPVVGKSVTIDGNVKRPAIYEAKKGETLADLINYAGGISATANKNDIRITRYDANEKVSIATVSFADARKRKVMDQDKVYVYGMDMSNIRGITLYGNVVKPGFWPLPKEGMSIEEFFKREIGLNTLRGVFLEQTYFDYAIIKRTSRNLKEELIGFSHEKALKGEEKILLHSRDELYVFNASAVESSPVVKISGECIARPGEYRYFDKMTFEALLATAGTTCPIDRTKVSIISRDMETMATSVRVVDSEKDKNIRLSRYDDIRTVGYFTTNPVKEVSIQGEVYKPGRYPIGDEGSTLRHLIQAAGGMTDKASLDKIEIVRYEIINGVRTRKVQNITPAQAMSEDSPAMMGYDEVTVFKIPQWNERKSVKIMGKVKYPGEYAIEDGDTLSDVLARAGGFTPTAYTPGAVFTRDEVKKRQQEGLQRQIKDLEQRMLFAASQPTEAGQNPADKMQMMSLLGTLKEEAAKIELPGRMAIRIDPDMTKFENSMNDIVLKNGDALYVPEREDSVVVQGEVLNPNAIVYNPEFTVEEYLSKAGGVKESAAEDAIFVVHVNGEAEGLERGFFGGSKVQVGPGDVIVVPMQVATLSGMQFAKDITSILYQLAVSVAALHTVGAL